MIGRDRRRRITRRIAAFLFGDRLGRIIFLASLCLFVSLWRTGFFINDSYTIANGLYAVSHGDMSMTVPEYGPLHSPGASLHRGEIFARNYGVIVLSLPFVLLLRAIDAVADFRLALIGLWSLLLFATLVLVGRELDRSRSFTIGGGVVVAVLFVLNVVLARPLSDAPVHLLALQLFHMTVAAFVGTLAYRLVRATNGTRLGVAAALLTVGGTPLAFWASVPKRHVITAAVALAVAVALLYSRDRNREWALEARALCYVLLALFAWVHAPEALVLFVAFVAVDVPTAPNNDLRTIGVLGTVFLIALLPLFVTNTLVSGDPLTVPRMLRSVSPAADISLDSGSTPSSAGNGGSGGLVLPTFLVAALSLLQSAFAPFQKLLDLLQHGLQTLFDRPTDAYRAFLRSGYVESIAAKSQESAAANLSLLESTPLLAILVTAVGTGVSTTRRAIANRTVPRCGTSADAFLATFAVTLSLVYLSSLPLHAQVTVRYLFPVAPILACLAIRLPPIERALDAHWQTLLWSSVAGVLIGGQLVLVALVALQVGRGEAFQFHALLALGVAALLAVWSLVASLTDRFDRVGAILLGLATATATIFVCFAAVEYYGLGQSHALPMLRVIAETLPLR